MSFDTQSAEFDAFAKAAKTWREQPGIVDNFYPEWRHGFENDLQAFFEAAQANGRFDPTSRFGMKLPGVALLRECMEKFRFYQGQHEQKAADLRALGSSWELRAQDSSAKAEVNRGIANRIESFLRNEK